MGSQVAVRVDRSTATTRWSCACRSWASPTGSSPCSPAGTAGSGPRPRACGAPRRGSAPGWSRSATSTCSSPATSATTRRSLHTIRQVESIELYGKHLGRDYPRYTAASAIAETAERLTPVEHEPSLRLFQLTLGALRALAGGRARQHAGARRVPAAGDGHRRLGAGAGRVRGLRRRPGRHAAFSVPPGGVVCPDCRPPGAARPAPATLELMVALAGRRLERRRRQRAAPPARVQRPGGGAPAVAPGARATLAAAGRPVAATATA